ncbi:hypothetical protein DFJ73DRAFT_755865 [Zopfochytrium polystomum]|nr:hypothetical protein DFJ73DRAFT_755865 [Zopfochytrium polystomum]
MSPHASLPLWRPRSAASALAFALCLAVADPANGASGAAAASQTPDSDTASLKPSDAVDIAMGAYAVVWIATLLLVFFITNREGVAIKQEILVLRAEHARKTGVTTAQHEPQQVGTLDRLASRKRSARFAPSPALTPINTSLAGRPKGNADDLEMQQMATEPVGGFSKLPPRHDSGPLVIPSTPTTTNLILQLAAGEDPVPLDDGCDDSRPAAASSSSSSAPAASTTAAAAQEQPAEEPEKKTAVGALKVESKRIRGNTPSIIFVAPQTESRPTLLMEAKTIPRQIHLWTRVLRLPNPHFTTTTESSYPANDPACRRFITPLSSTDPLAVRVHRLIHAAIRADLAVLESQLRKRGIYASNASPKLPLAAITLLGFLMLASFLILWGSGVNSWGVPGLASLWFLIASSLGVLVVISALIRDQLTELKAERGVLRLSAKRLHKRAPYTLEFTSERIPTPMDAWDWCLVPFIFVFALVAAAARIDAGWWRASKTVEDRSDAAAWRAAHPRLFFATGKVYPVEWTVTAHLRTDLTSPPQQATADSTFDSTGYGSDSEFGDAGDASESAPRSPPLASRQVAIPIIVGE